MCEELDLNEPELDAELSDLLTASESELESSEPASPEIPQLRDNQQPSTSVGLDGGSACRQLEFPSDRHALRDATNIMTPLQSFSIDRTSKSEPSRRKQSQLMKF